MSDARVNRKQPPADVFGERGAHVPAPATVHDALPDTLLRRVKQYSGRLATEAVHSMQDQLPYFSDLDAAQRASVQLVVQTAVVNFVEWIQDPEGNVKFTVQAFQVVPQDLARRITLLQTVEMVRVAMEFFEKWLPLLARNDAQLRALTESVLRYGREIGFAAAAIYASAAESRGAWDSRLEALVVDAVVRGDTGPQLLSRAAALNWDSDAPATVIVGTPPPEQNVSVPLAIHNTAKSFDRSALSVVQGSVLVAIVSGPARPTEKFVGALLSHFADGPVVIGPTMPNLGSAHSSATEAMAGIEAVAGWPSAPRPVHSLELLPERALNGDESAMTALIESLVQPLAEGGATLSTTLEAYLDSGGSVESCARILYIHPNTVRYRLKKISEITGRDPTNPRDAYVLRVASTVGRLTHFRHKSPTSAT
ncbi:PucR family transcriptional regulator [Gordonia sp. JH63]|uniref:PucR family transcriptional regulator n=1 Tax=Gordonia TaxID=2053 RepID=UPI00080DDD11|nr:MULTISPECIES: helix-turn-helix domain-containing protein [unclassified Gordonia (in: high G+C Gram-positive bacteria)]MCZ4534872.1 helix-turn-helix domain-containing protein [Gordonia terrae]MCT1353863.1 helix-turn-helix domain-containing protein [Gordonia sp. p3-SID1431]OCH82081.1 PucR family transcriptional regulator [Gordonia sp. UCD-TK1]QHD86543.1 PucR family transcriptional regulator [Gordonia sp. JH63]UCZ91290.1 helix-turn-helix domain-containing protein [Gordonia sp. WA4-43]